MIRTSIIFAAALLSTACMTGDDRSAAPTASASTSLVSGDGTSRGRASLSETATGITVRADVRGLPAGAHGIHVHAVGRCDAPDFASAGPHWNPTARQHGRENPQGAHHGDLPNIEVGADGSGTLSYTLTDARFAQLFDADGAALVVHAGADDGRTDPSGNSGGRIACGVIERR